MSKTLRYVLLVVSSVITFSLAAAVTFYGFKISKVFVKSPPTTETGFAQAYTKDHETKESLNILLLGRGGEGHDGGTLADSLIVVSLDSQNRSATLVNIPRDLWVPIPYDWENLENYKINMAYAIGLDDLRYANKKPEFRGKSGGGTLSKHVVGQVVGFDIDYFIAVDFASFESIIDLLGGIDVNVSTTFDDYFYPIKGNENETCGKSGEEIATLASTLSGFELEKQFTCRYEHLHFDSGLNTLDGKTALKFVRSRHSDQHGGDFARSERQFAVLAGIKNTILSRKLLDNFDPLIDQLAASTTTDLTIPKLRELSSLVTNPTDYEIKTVYLSDQNVLMSSTSQSGQYILIPKAGINNFTHIQQFIQSSVQKEGDNQ